MITLHSTPKLQLKKDRLSTNLFHTFSIKQVCLLTCLMFACINASAQMDSVRHARFMKLKNNVDSIARTTIERIDNSTEKRKLDSVLDKVGSRAKYDTTYIIKPKEHWTFKVLSNFFGSHLRIDTKENDIKSMARLDARMKVTLSFSASYRGLGLSFSINPGKWTGKSNDFEMDVCSYGNSFGFDATYTSANSYHGSWYQDNKDYDIIAGSVEQKLVAVNAYYSFNKRHFSYPAAFSQSQIQKRSCGTWLLSASFANSRLHIAEQAEIRNEPMHQTSTYIGLGGGYGYNLVTPHNWMFHLSATPELILFNHSKAETDITHQHVPYRFPNIIAIAKLGIVHHYKKQFFGCTAVFNNSATGDIEKAHIFNIKWRARAFWGIRI